MGLTAAFWVYSQKPVLYNAERLFQFNYSLENAPIVEKESNDVVTILRSAQLKEQLGMQETTVTVFKPGPFSITLQAKSVNPEAAVVNLNKISYYLSSAYQVKEIGSMVFYKENSHPERIFLLGILAGIGSGILVSLVISYIKTY